MCNYFSGILTEKGEVLWLKENPLNHEAIIEAYKLTDTETKNRKWIRFEITPKCTSELVEKVKTRSQLTRDLFKFSWDHEGELPTWLEKKCVEMIERCWLAAEESWKIHYLLGDEVIQELKEKGYIHMMWGSSKVGVMWESSQVGVMWGSSKVGEMWESSQVGVMRESSQVGVMWESSQVGEMWESSQVGVMRESSQVGVMRESSQVGVMRESSQVGEMRESSQVGEMNHFATAVKNNKLYTATAAEVVRAGLVEA